VTICSFCQFENADGARTCAKCGEPLLQYNHICGMPMLGGSSRGQVLAMRYIIDRQVGEDAAGCIYKAEDAADGTAVLIRALPVGLGSDPQKIERLEDGAEKLAALSHPDIRHFRSLHTGGDIKYFVCEYPEGLRLDQALDNERPMRVGQVLSVFGNIAAALDYAHGEGLLHGGIKPENIFVAGEKTGGLADFGISRVVEEAAGGASENDTSGWYRFRAPEQLDERQTSKYSDIYSLAACIYECLSTRPPYWLGWTRYSLLEEDPERLCLLSDLQNSVLRRSLSPNPDERHRSATDLLKDLRDTGDAGPAAALKEVKLGLEVERRAREQIDAGQASCRDAIEKLKAQTAAQADEHAAALKQAYRKMEKLSDALARMDGNVEAVIAENRAALEKAEASAARRAAVRKDEHAARLKQVEHKVEELSRALAHADKNIETIMTENRAALEKAEASAARRAAVRKDEHTARLDKMNRKIASLSGEIERFSRSAGMQSKSDGRDTSARRFSTTAAMLAALALALLCGASVYLYQTSDSRHKNMLKQWLSVFVSSGETGGQTQGHGQTAAVQPVDPAAEVTQKPDSPTAEQVHLEAAEKGDSNAMYKLGDAYLRGTGTEKNIKKAAAWFEKAALAGNDAAMFQLGLMYYSGEGMPKDHGKAFELFRESARAGHQPAMYNIAWMYQRGEGTETDDAKALQWYERAAEEGFTKAMNQLAQMYYFGDLVEQNFKQAALYYQRSARAGDQKGMYNLAVLYHNGIGVERDISKSMLWFIKAARQGDPDSMYRLGEMFQDGPGIEKDLEKAVFWYRKAAEAGHEAAERKLAELDGVPQEK